MSATTIRQHVLIAEGLIDQYPDAMARFMTAWKDSEDAEMSVARAEVERVYTGIWEQLDTAAKLTEATGRSAGQYREIRSTPGLEVGAAIFDARERLAGIAPSIRGAQLRSELTVQHNVVGVDLARRAAQDLKEQWPELDWTPPDEPDVDLRPAGFGRLVGWLAGLFR